MIEKLIAGCYGTYGTYGFYKDEKTRHLDNLSFPDEAGHGSNPQRKQK